MKDIQCNYCGRTQKIYTLIGHTEYCPYYPFGGLEIVEIIDVKGV